MEGRGKRLEDEIKELGRENVGNGLKWVKRRNGVVGKTSINTGKGEERGCAKKNKGRFLD